MDAMQVSPINLQGPSLHGAKYTLLIIKKRGGGGAKCLLHFHFYLSKAAQSICQQAVALLAKYHLF